MERPDREGKKIMLKDKLMEIGEAQKDFLVKLSVNGGRLNLPKAQVPGWVYNMIPYVSIENSVEKDCLAPDLLSVEEYFLIQLTDEGQLYLRNYFDKSVGGTK